jgi:hypothetical protein
MPDGDPPKTPRSRAPALARTEFVPPPPDETTLCPECGVAVADLETHLRHVHRLYLFRGVHRSYNDAFALLLDALVAPRPDPHAWRTLSALAREDHGPRADAFLAAVIGQRLARLADDRRPAAVAGLAGLLAAAPLGLAAALASDAEQAARELALSVFARRPSPFDPALIPPLRGLLLDRRLPVPGQLAAFAALWRSTDADGALANEMLRTLVGGLGKKRSIDRLREFEKLVGDSPAIEAVCEELEGKLRMTCPRCAVELRRPEMAAHLWQAHRLMLDVRRVRDPWQVIEEAVAVAREKDDPEMAERCRGLASEADPRDGPARFERILLRHGFGGPESIRALLADAVQRHATVCPGCRALIPRPRPAPPLEVTVRAGRLTADRYSVVVSERGLRPRLVVRTAVGVVVNVREPGRKWTGRGSALLAAAPLVALAWAAALAGERLGVPPIVPTLLVLLAAAAVYAVVRLPWGRPTAERALRGAWEAMTPRLHAGGFSPDDAALAAGLARATAPGAFRERRAPRMAALIKQTEDAVASGLAPAESLAALQRLFVADAAAAGADPVPLLAEQAARCFDGRLPMDYAQRLLSGEAPPGWTAAAAARLRVWLCDRAFEAGFEVRDLVHAGRTAPALGAVLRTDDPAGLAALRLLWARRPLKPWDHCGPAITAFEAAADPTLAALWTDHPDLLLWQRDATWVIAADGEGGDMGPAEVSVCTSGVWLHGVCFAQQPKAATLTRKQIGSELNLDGRVFRSSNDLDGLARRMERWFRWYFGDFRPEAAVAASWPTPDRGVALRARGAISCPECGRWMLPRVGEVGASPDEAK